MNMQGIPQSQVEIKSCITITDVMCASMTRVRPQAHVSNLRPPARFQKAMEPQG